MALKEFSTYINRPIENFEKAQKYNFNHIYKIINSTKEKPKDYELATVGFLSPHGDSWMKIIIEEKKPGYTLCLLHDLALRNTKKVLECLIPSEVFDKHDLKNRYPLCIQFDKFKKEIIEYKSTYKSSNLMVEKSIAKWSIISIEDFNIINPSRLRLVSAKESNEAAQLRSDILFKELGVDIPSHVKLSIINTIFLSPKVGARTGIETKSFINNSSRGRFLINIDHYNNLMKKLIPPEISNSQYEDYRGDIIHLYIPRLHENLVIRNKYPTLKYSFSANCSPNQKEDMLSGIRGISNNEIGINHQTKFETYLSKKSIIDKLTLTEFFYKQDYMPQIPRIHLNKSISLIKSNNRLLYEDYVSRLYKPIEIKPLTVSEKHKIESIATDYCEELGYLPKQNHDGYLNSIKRTVMENLSRVKAVVQRSDFMGGRGLALVYLNSISSNFDEIRESKDYNNLSSKDVDTAKVRRIMNNLIRNQIISLMKRKGYKAVEEDVIFELEQNGHNKKAILKEMTNLMNGGIIYKIGELITLEDSIL